MKIFLFILFIFTSMVSFADIPISTIEELQKIGNDPAYPLNGSYYLTNDINASDTRNWNDGKGFKPIMKMQGEEYLPFKGSFNGRGFKIKNLHIKLPEIDRVGLFGYIEGGQIKNLKMDNVNIIGGSYTGVVVGYAEFWNEDDPTEIENVHLTNVSLIGNINIGGIAGYFNGYMINCSVNGNISGNSFASGLAGTSNAVIERSSAIVNVSAEFCTGLTDYSAFISQCYTGGTLTGKNCGGLIGENFNGRIQNCFSNCNINATENGGDSGGLVRENQWKVNNSYATGQISGKGNLKGLIAVWGWYFPDPPEVTDSFYDYQTTGQYDDNFDDYGIPKSTKDMMDPATFENWDFENVWWMVPGKTYPLLRPERYIDVSLKPAEWMLEPKYGFPLEYEIVFGEEMSDRFTFDDIDFTSSTLESPVGTLTTENGTTWTLMITDTASTPTWPGDLVLRVPLAGATNPANYPCAESNATSITIQAPAITGDFNGDGVCDNIDKMILGEMIIEPSSPWKTRIPFTRRDLNSDNILDVADVVAILPLMNKSQ